MKHEDAAISPHDIYIRTAQGEAAKDDPARALSAGFREMLRSIDGKRSVLQLAALFPRLDAEDVNLWLAELLRMRLIDFADIPFELPDPKVEAKGASASIARPGAAATAFDIDEMAASMSEWLMMDTEAFGAVRKSELAKTIRMAALESTQALHSLEDSGFFANLMDPLPIDGHPAPANKVPLATEWKVAAKKGLALVFETDPADTALLSTLLNGVGYQAQLCSSRQQLVLLLNQPVPPDMIILKSQAKDVDVFKVLEKLRLHPRLAKAAVVLTADQPSREDIAKSILLGVNSWMRKPYTAQAIAAAVKSAVGAAPAG